MSFRPLGVTTALSVPVCSVLRLFCRQRPSPGDGVAADLKEPEELLGLFSVSVLLFGRQGVVGNQQRVGSSSWWIRSNSGSLIADKHF